MCGTLVREVPVLGVGDCPGTRADAGVTPGSLRTRLSPAGDEHRVLALATPLRDALRVTQPCPTPTRGWGCGKPPPPAAEELKRQGWESVRSAAVRYGAR